MISLESRIYADADAVAAEITPGDIPPLRLAAALDRRSRSNGHGHPGARFWLAPLTAAASVVAITTTMIIAGQANSGSRAPVGHVHPATGGRSISHSGSALGPEALDYFFPATGAQYTAGLAYGWTQAKIRAHFYGSCMARAGYPQTPFAEPEQTYLQAFPDNSQFPDLAQRARTGTMTGSSVTGMAGPPRSVAGRAAARRCEAPANAPFAVIGKVATPLQSQWLSMVTAVQTSARVTALQPGFAACLQAHGVPASYARQQRPTASNPLFTGFFAWMDHLGQTTTSGRQLISEQHRWTPVFVACAGPTVNLIQRLQLAQRTRFFSHYARQIAMISKLATELPGTGR